MNTRRALHLATAAFLAPAAIAATNPAADASGSAPSSAVEAFDVANVERIEQMPIEWLEANLPRNAFEAGMDYAPKLVKVHADRLGRNVISNSGLDVTEHAGHGYVEVVIGSAEQQALLDSLGFKQEVVREDLIARERERILLDAEFAQLNVVSSMPSGRTTYRQLADYRTEIDALAAAAPDLAKYISLGQSAEGRDLAGIEIGEDVNEPEDGRPVLLMFGNHHAREWPSAETPMEFAHELVGSYLAGDARTVDLLGRARVIIVPVSNPDGYTYSRQSGDLLDLNTLDGGGTVSILSTPGQAYKRKNCMINPGAFASPQNTLCLLTSSNGGFGIGTDLNRNYGALWGGPGATAAPVDDNDAVGLQTATLYASALYQGPAPFSEPETQAIRTLISTRQVTTLLSNHTFSNLLLRPVGLVPSTEHPDGFPVGFAPDECFIQADGRDNGMQALGERMSAQSGYSNQFGWELYDTTGTTEDYSYNATGGYGFTYEIGPDEFHPPFENVINEWTGNTDAAQGVPADNPAAVTTGSGQDCGAEKVAADIVGGGLREGYYLALENAADTNTHSLITGTAPEGAEITVTRTGDFPLWDGTGVEDTVTTTMVADGGAFEYHVNPSTRPFSASRPYDPSGGVGPELNTVSSQEATGAPLPPNAGQQNAGFGNDDTVVTVGPDIDAITVTMTSTLPTDDYDLYLFDPEGVELASSGNVDSNEYVQFSRPTGIAEGDYVVRAVNFAAAGPYQATIELGAFPPADEAVQTLEFTPETVEQWTLTCTLGGETLTTKPVTVDRGEAVDVGAVCVTAAAESEPTAAPAPEQLPSTGGGAILAGFMALGTATVLRRRG